MGAGATLHFGRFASCRSARPPSAPRAWGRRCFRADARSGFCPESRSAREPPASRAGERRSPGPGLPAAGLERRPQSARA
eukprot:2443282-Prorocentrum_lima.AAC.1